jgi:hypothetical protein
MTALSRALPFALTLALFAGCATQPAPTAKPDYQNEVIGEVIKAKVQKNGADLLCDQEGYRGCYKISREQCLTELNSVKDDCFKRANDRVPRIMSEGEMKQFAQQFGSCLALRHLQLHQDKNLAEIGECMQKMSYDKAQGAKSIMK